MKQQVDCLAKWRRIDSIFGTISPKIPPGWAGEFDYVDDAITMPPHAQTIEATATVMTASSSEGKGGSVGALVTAHPWPTGRDRGTILGSTGS